MPIHCKRHQMPPVSVTRKIQSFRFSFILRISTWEESQGSWATPLLLYIMGLTTPAPQSVASFRDTGWPHSSRLGPTRQHPASGKAEAVGSKASLKWLELLFPPKNSCSCLHGGRRVRMETQHKLVASQASSPTLGNTKDGATEHHR